VTLAICSFSVSGYHPVSQIDASWPGAKNASFRAASRLLSRRVGSPARIEAELISGGTVLPAAAARMTAAIFLG
jgi:hypothetical protein